MNISKQKLSIDKLKPRIIIISILNNPEKKRLTILTLETKILILAI